MLFTFNTLLKEIREIPSNRLDELYEFVHSLNPKIKKSETQRKKILAFAGSFADMNDKEYASFVKETKRTRAILFDRKFQR